MAAGSNSVKLIQVKTQADATKRLLCNEAGLRALLSATATRSRATNAVAVLGKARSGKSTLLSMLSGHELFVTGHTSRPVTQGVDLATIVQPHSAIFGGHPSTAEPLIAWMDAEGCGDSGLEHDIMLYSCMLLVAKVVILQVSGGIQKESVLQQCGILVEIAQRLQLGTGGFGHLHIRFTDIRLAVDTRKLHAELLTAEPASTPEAAARNRIRDGLRSWFQTISLHVFPRPTAHKAGSQVSMATAGDKYCAKLLELKTAIAEQLQQPAVIGGRHVTGGMICSLVPQVVTAMNTKADVLPDDMVKAWLRSSAGAQLESALSKLEEQLTDMCEQCYARSPPATVAVALAAARASSRKLCRELLMAVDTAMGSEMRTQFRIKGERHIDACIADYRARLHAYLRNELEACRLSVLSSMQALASDSSFDSAFEQLLARGLATISRLEDTFALDLPATWAAHKAAVQQDWNVVRERQVAKREEAAKLAEQAATVLRTNLERQRQEALQQKRQQAEAATKAYKQRPAVHVHHHQPSSSGGGCTIM